MKALICTLLLGLLCVASLMGQSTSAASWTMTEWRNYTSYFSVHPKPFGNKKVEPFYLNIPTGSADGSDGMGYFTTAYKTPIVGTELVYTFEILTTGTPVFNANLQADNQASNCYAPSGYPAIVTPILVRTGAYGNLTYPDPGQYYRWFARDYRVAIVANTTVQVTVPLDPAAWMSVYGVFGDQNPAMFQATLDDPMEVGLVFGGGCYLSHGINVQQGSGTAQFVLVNFQIQ